MPLVTSVCTFIQVTQMFFKDYLEEKVEGEGIFFLERPVTSALVGNQDVKIFVESHRSLLYPHCSPLKGTFRA